MRVGQTAMALLAAAAIAWTAAAPAAAGESGAPILLYHRFEASRAGSAMEVTTPVFEQQLNWLADHGYKVARLGAVVEALRDGAPIEPRTVVITADDGRRSQYTDMYPIILRHGTPVTLFVYTHAISAEPEALTWEQINEMAKSGLIDVQSHTYTHPHFARERARRRPADFAAFVVTELQGSKATIEERLKRPVKYLAWPYGSDAADLERAASAAGYCAAFVVAGRRARAGDDPFAMPRIVVRNADVGERFDRLLNLGGPQLAAAAEPPAACVATSETSSR